MVCDKVTLVHFQLHGSSMLRAEGPEEEEAGYCLQTLNLEVQCLISLKC